ncbi:MAG TPA: trigger factor [Planctomycetaceae bacterium]|nr:trigger factor [Planctomycetaceae bacterium]
MSPADDKTKSGGQVETDDATSNDGGEPEKQKLELHVEIKDAGPCKKHVRVRIPRSEVDRFYEETVKTLAERTAIPGFRPGHVPQKLVEKRFRTELANDVKQRVLVESMEQLSDNKDLDPINEPDIDVEAIELPEEGDFEYEFDIEVRPEFKLPNYQGLTITRPVREVTDADVEKHFESFLSQYGQLAPHEGPVEPGDVVSVSLETERDGQKLLTVADASLRVRPVLRFADAELNGFDKLMSGAQSGDERTTTVTVAPEAEEVELRGEKIEVRFKVLDVKRWRKPELTKELLTRIGVESEEELRNEIRESLGRRVTFEQRQAVREQVSEKITESATWDLPEQLVRRQVENALRRTVLEMQQAGFTTREIQARENQLRQNAVTSTRQALKEHFILDKIADEEKVEVTPQDIQAEIRLMAQQRGETPRRVRAKMEKSGMIENLEAQIRERKAVDVILERAKYKDVPMELSLDERVEPVPYSVCRTHVVTETAEAEAEEAKAAE